MKMKFKRATLRGFWHRRHSPYTMPLYNWLGATQTSLANRLNLQYIKCYHNSKYEPSVFSAIFRHKQPQNVNLKQLALLK